LDALIAFDYKGDIFPVNPKVSTIRGLKTYPDFMSVPESPDYVICCIPASLTPGLVRDCVERGVKAISVYTAGFSEIGEDGRVLENEIARLARHGGLRLIGPNCMGIYCPGTRLSYSSLFSREAGCVGLLCQSGGISLGLTIMANSLGVRFSKVISYGNAADLAEADMIDYLAHDSETRIIGAYIEGVKDGQRLLESLKLAAKAKPVAILKGGRTVAGARATASHTGSLAGHGQLWNALARQTGAIEVYSPEEMVDFIETHLYMKLPKGRRVGVIAWGGGPSVLTTDDCERAGLTVRAFSDELRKQLNGFIAPAGSSVSNPVDSPALADPRLLSDVIRVVAGSGEVDFLLIRMPLATSEPPFDLDNAKGTIEAIIETRKSTDLPMAVVQPHFDAPQSSGVFLSMHQRCVDTGLPLFSTTTRAANAISRFIRSTSHLGA
jgi:acyl-CoA synthetase (NDP forming)